MMHPLLRPFAYLGIRHQSALPVWVNWVLPFILSAICTFFLYKWLPAQTLLSENGFVARVLGFVQSLAGFYMAALAAIATFNNADMDRLMPGNPPTMSIIYNGALEKVKLTRRRFLSSMFAYLTLISILLTLASIGALAIGGSLPNWFDGKWDCAIKLALLFGYTLSIAQMICVTVWGLFYLGERIHTPDT
jgi:hypothetical protein